MASSASSGPSSPLVALPIMSGPIDPTRSQHDHDCDDEETLHKTAVVHWREAALRVSPGAASRTPHRRSTKGAPSS